MKRSGLNPIVFFVQDSGTQERKTHRKTNGMIWRRGNFVERGRFIALAALIVVVVFFAGFKIGQGGYFQTADKPSIEVDTPDAGTEKTVSKEKPADIWVYVVGQVKTPGVERLSSGSRVFEAVNLAVALPDADVKQLDMARPLTDGEKITVPKVGEQLPISPASAGTIARSASSAPVGGGLINLNTASATELDQGLTGIGPALAERIIEYRTANGPFTSIEQLKDVSGIGDKKFEAIKDRITVGP